MLGRGFSAVLKTARNVALAVGAIAGAVVGLAIKGGIARALDIEDAQAKLRGLGHDAGTIDQIMDNALQSVLGTAFRLDAAATVAAGAVAAGIQPGQDLERTLKAVADTATIAGADLDEIGDIFNKVASGGRVTARELNQLTQRGVPALQFLADELGVTTEEVRKMVSQGAVDFETFRDAMESNLAGAALASGETTRGAFRNMGAAMSRWGATIVEPLLPLVRNVFVGMTEVWDRATEALGPLLDRIQESGAFQRFADATADIPGIFDRIAKRAKPVVNAIKSVFDTFKEGDGVIDGLRRVFDRVVNWLATGGIQQILDGLLRSRQRLFDAATQLFPAILDAALVIIPEIAQWVTGTLIPTLVDLLTSSIGPVLDAAVQLFSTLIEAASEILPDVLTAVVDAVTDIASTLLEEAPQLLQAGIDTFLSLVDAILEVLPDLLDTITGEVLPQLVATIVDAAPRILDGAVELFTSIVEAVTVILPDLLDAVAALIPDIVEALVTLAPQILEAGITLMNEMVAALSDPEFLDRLLSAAVAVVLALAQAIVTEGPKMLAAGLVMMSRMILGFVSGQVTMVASIVRTVTGALVDALSDLWNVIWEWGGDIVKRAAQGVLGAGKFLRDALIEVVTGGLVDTETFNAAAAQNVGSALDAAMAQGIDVGSRDVSDAARNVGTDAVTELLQDRIARQSGEQTISGFAAGMTARQSDVRSAVAAMTQIVRDFLPSSPARTGPLSGGGAPMQAGIGLARDFAAGITNGAAQVVQSVTTMMIRVADVMVRATAALIRVVGPLISDFSRGFRERLGSGVFDWLRDVGVATMTSRGAQLAAAFTRGFREAAGGLRDQMRDVVQRGLDGLAALGPAFESAGRTLMLRFGTGITRAASQVLQALSRIVSSIRRMLPSSPAREGPLSGQGDPFRAGEELARRIAQGISATAGDITGALQRGLVPAAAAVSLPAAAGNGGAGAGLTVALAPGAVVVNNPASTVDVERAVYGAVAKLAEARNRRGKG